MTYVVNTTSSPAGASRPYFVDATTSPPGVSGAGLILFARILRLLARSRVVGLQCSVDINEQLDFD